MHQPHAIKISVFNTSFDNLPFCLTIFRQDVNLQNTFKYKERCWQVQRVFCDGCIVECLVICQTTSFHTCLINPSRLAILFLMFLSTWPISSGSLTSMTKLLLVCGPPPLLPPDALAEDKLYPETLVGVVMVCSVVGQLYFLQYFATLPSWIVLLSVEKTEFLLIFVFPERP